MPDSAQRAKPVEARERQLATPHALDDLAHVREAGELQGLEALVVRRPRVRAAGDASSAPPRGARPWGPEPRGQVPPRGSPAGAPSCRRRRWPRGRCAPLRWRRAPAYAKTSIIISIFKSTIIQYSVFS